MKLIFVVVVMLCGTASAGVYNAKGRMLEIPTPSGYILAPTELRNALDAVRLKMGGSVDHRFVLFARECSIDSTGLIGDTLSINLTPKSDITYTQDDFSSLKKKMMGNSKIAAAKLPGNVEFKWCKDRGQWTMSKLVMSQKAPGFSSPVRYCYISGTVLIDSNIYNYVSQSIFVSEEETNELIKGIEQWLGEMTGVKANDEKNKCTQCGHLPKEAGRYCSNCGAQMKCKPVKQFDIEILKACAEKLKMALGDKAKEKIEIKDVMGDENPKRKGLFWVDMKLGGPNRLKVKEFPCIKAYRTELDLDAVWISGRTGRIVSLEFGKNNCETEVKGGLRSASWLQNQIELELGSKFELVQFNRDNQRTQYSLMASDKGLKVDLTIHYYKNLDASAISLEIFSLDASLR